MRLVPRFLNWRLTKLNRQVYNSVSIRIRADATSVFDVKAEAEQLQSAELKGTREEPGLAEALLDLDDETLRRIFKMHPLLKVDDPRLDEGQQAVDQPPFKGDNLRQGHGEREPVAGMAAKMKGLRHYKRHPGVDVSVKDLVVM